MVSLSKNKWLNAAIDYISSWIELQLRASGQPGCAVAIALKERFCSTKRSASPTFRPAKS